MFKFLEKKPFELQISHDMWLDDATYLIPRKIHRMGKKPYLRVRSSTSVNPTIKVIDSDGTIEVFRGMQLSRGIPHTTTVTISKK